MKRIVLASHNNGKIEEIKSMLSSLNIEVIGMHDIDLIEEIVEDADTLEGNAITKAKCIHEKIGGYTLADDTGLFVNALKGKPGVHTARFAGENCTDQENRNKILEILKNEEDRTAVFKTVLVLVDKNGKEYIVEGTCEGTIAKDEIGDRGFGYDKIFVPNGYDKTFSQLSLGEKNKISHRAKALLKLKKLLVDILNENSDC